MKLLLTEMKIRKIDAIKCIRNWIPGLGLREAKEICERLPFEVTVRAEDVHYLEDAFKFQTTNTVQEDVLRSKWDALSPDRQLMILQLLEAEHRLD